MDLGSVTVNDMNCKYKSDIVFAMLPVGALYQMAGTGVNCIDGLYLGDRIQIGSNKIVMIYK